MLSLENELKIRPGDKVTIEHPRHGMIEVVVQTAQNWTYSQTPTADSDWYIEGRAWDGAIYWKQKQDGGHIVKHNGEKVGGMIKCDWCGQPGWEGSMIQEGDKNYCTRDCQIEYKAMWE